MIDGVLRVTTTAFSLFACCCVVVIYDYLGFQLQSYWSVLFCVQRRAHWGRDADPKGSARRAAFSAVPSV